MKKPKEFTIGSAYRRLVACLLIGGFSLVAARAATIDITTYGANGSDADDDKAAIQNAINAAGSGDTVYFPNGTYHISGQILPKSNIKLTGQSQSGSILKFTASNLQAMITMNQMTSVEVSNLTLDGNNNVNASQGIYAYRGKLHKVHHLTIKNLTASTGYGPFGIHFNGTGKLGVTDSLITDNTISNIGIGSSWGGGIRCSSGSSRNKILRNTISNTGRGGIFSNDGSTDLVIQHNTVTGSGKKDHGLGIEVWGTCHRALIEDNKVDHWISIDSSSNCALRRNLISDKAELIIALAGIELVGSTNTVCTDNTVDHGALIGLSLSNNPEKNYGYFAYNTIQYCAQWGAQFQGDANGLRYHYLYKNKFLNTVRNHPKAWYPNDSGHGFRFNGNAWYVTLDSNEIRDNQNFGIQFSDDIDQVSVVNNIITGNGGAAATPYKGVDLEWSGNTIRGNANNSQQASRGFGNAKPTASCNLPAGTKVGQAVSFVSTSSDPNGSIGHYLWDFGHGLPSTNASPTHTYTKAGTYRVTLVVWDNLGRGARAEKAIAVGEAANGGTAEPGNATATSERPVSSLLYCNPS